MGKKDRKPRIPPTPEERESMLGQHIKFEIRRFRSGAWVWDQNKTGRVVIGTTADAMMRESCLIHTRILLDFFFPRGNTFEFSNHRDVFSGDYVPDSKLSPEFRKLLEPEDAWLKNLKTYRSALDTQLAHLTLNRKPMPPWDDVMLKHLENLIVEYLKAAVPAERHAEFERDL